MKAVHDKRTLKGLCAALLALCLSATLPARAGEPVTPPPDGANKSNADALLAIEAQKQERLRKEIEAEVENKYQVARRLYENFEYEEAKREL